MTTSIPTASASKVRVPLRLALHRDARSGPLDGAWWPQTRDLQVEGADLVDEFPDASGRVARLLFSRPDWDGADARSAPHRIVAQRGAVKVGSFPRDDTHLMIVILSTRERLRLLVVPPAMSRQSADELMRIACEPRNASTASELLASVATSFETALPLADSVWDDDGGAGLRDR